MEDNKTTQQPETGENQGAGQQDQMVSMSDVEKIVNSALEKQKTEFENHKTKLNEENKNRRIESKELKSTLAEMLGLNKEEASDMDKVKGSINELANSYKSLKTELEESKAEKAKILKQTQIKEAANKLGFADGDDALRFVKLDTQDVEGDLKKLLEGKPYLAAQKKQDLPGVNPVQKNSQDKIRQEFNELHAKPNLTGREMQRLNELAMQLEKTKG